MGAIEKGFGAFCLIPISAAAAADMPTEKPHNIFVYAGY